MRVVFAGTPEVAVPSLEAVAASGHELVGVVTRPDAPSGRGRRLTASPVAQRAVELGVPVLKPEHPRDPDFQEALRALRPDCCPVVAYGALLPQSALDIPPHGWVNLHFSCLPAWRGAAPVQHAVWAGDEVTGATTFRIVKAMDAGPTFGVMTERIRPTDTAGDLLGRLAEGGAGLLVATLDGIEDGSLVAREQPEDGVSLAPKILVEDAEVDWREPAPAVDRRIRACTPGPGAWSTFEGERIKIGPVEITDGALPPGEIVVGKNHVVVGTGTHAVSLGEVKAFGKKQMRAADWARGVRLESGARLGAPADVPDASAAPGAEPGTEPTA
ncbi:methionyl-tRNA formyltransferase [Nocardioides kribbensis]|uniref:Methionyl-tRNA formyltransferase n=1 Tax=Nocardioides kribbensis TaxID=305517 RepID=A0ABV1P3V8_9ACTN|nr:methionyl-tRNA formyltransferase [Nocardioides kribbensis]